LPIFWTDEVNTVVGESDGCELKNSEHDGNKPVKLVPNSWSSLRECSNVARAWSAVMRLFQSLITASAASSPPTSSFFQVDLS